MQYRRTAIAVLAATVTVIAAASPASARWRGHHHHHHGWGWGGAGIGFATGALIGSALAAPRYYGGPYAYGPAPYVVDDGPYAYGMSNSSSDDAYCSQRFKSYDPSSGTYMGYDGQRHPCP